MLGSDIVVGVYGVYYTCMSENVNKNYTIHAVVYIDMASQKRRNHDVIVRQGYIRTWNTKILHILQKKKHLG